MKFYGGLAILLATVGKLLSHIKMSNVSQLSKLSNVIFSYIYYGGSHEFKIGFYGLIFLCDNTNQVMENPIPKFRQSSIISKKPGYVPEKIKILASYNYHRV